MSIETRIASITEDRRAGYLWDTKTVAATLGMHPNKFNQWWRRNRAFLVALAVAQPGETAAEVACVLAEALSERTRRGLDSCGEQMAAATPSRR
jgi:hypothetical protein